MNGEQTKRMNKWEEELKASHHEQDLPTFLKIHGWKDNIREYLLPPVPRTEAIGHILKIIYFFLCFAD